MQYFFKQLWCLLLVCFCSPVFRNNSGFLLDGNIFIFSWTIWGHGLYAISHRSYDFQEIIKNFSENFEIFKILCRFPKNYFFSKYAPFCNSELTHAQILPRLPELAATFRSDRRYFRRFRGFLKFRLLGLPRKIQFDGRDWYLREFPNIDLPLRAGFGSKKFPLLARFLAPGLF